MDVSIYQSIYNSVADLIFGSTALTGYPELVVTLYSSFAVLFCAALPFFFVYKFCVVIFNLGGRY